MILLIADVYPGEEKMMSDIFKQGTADVIPALNRITILILMFHLTQNLKSVIIG